MTAKRIMTKYRPMWSWKGVDGTNADSRSTDQPLFDSVIECCQYMKDENWSARGHYVEYMQWCEPVEVEVDE